MTNPNPVEPEENTTGEANGPSGLLRCDRAWPAALVLFFLALLTFLPSLRNDFVSYDDPDYVTANPYVQQGMTGDGIKWAFRSTEIGNWHPLTRLSHMLDCQLFGLKPAGHHFTSVLLHALNTLLVFLVFRRMTGRHWLSFFIAALFGLHPLRVESVTWISERKDVLSMFFGLLALWCYTRYAESVEQKNDKPVRYYVPALLLYACSLMSKPMWVTLPGILLLLDHWPLNRLRAENLRRVLAEKVPFALLALGICFVAFASQHQAGAVQETSLSYRLQNAVVAYAQYLKKLLLPNDLAFFYPHPAAWPIAGVALAALLLIGISAAAIVLRKRHPFLLVGWLWFLGTLVPVIGLVQIGKQSMADRYTYLPSLGLLLMLVWSVHLLIQWRWRLKLAAFAISGAAVIASAVMTIQQIGSWKNDERLARRAIAVTKDNYLAHDLLGSWYERQGSHTEAQGEHYRAMEIKPDYADAYNHAGVALAGMGRFPDAIKEYEHALKLRATFPEALYNLAGAQAEVGRLEEAQGLYLRALQLRPAYTDAHYNLGLLLNRMGKPDAASREFQETLRLTPNSAETENNLAYSLEKLGRLDEAIVHYQRAIQLKPAYARAVFNLGVVMGRKGDLDSAANCFAEALRLKPDYAAAATNLNLIKSMKSGANAPRN